jgi:cell division protein FtsQ
MTSSNLNRRKASVSEKPRPGAVLGMAMGLGGVIALGGLFWLGRWATESKAFALKQVSVTGNERATASELARMSGVTLGHNLFHLDVEAAEEGVGAHPWVASVNVSRRFPNRLTISVVEHKPVAWVALGELYLVNSQGRPFKKATAKEDFDLPVLTGIDRAQFIGNGQGGADRIVHALSVMEAYNHLPEAKRAPLSEVRLMREGLVLVVGNGEEIRLGAEDAIERLSKLSLVREGLMRQGLSSRVIHLDNRARPDWITVQLAAPHSERRGPRVH